MAKEIVLEVDAVVLTLLNSGAYQDLETAIRPFQNGTDFRLYLREARLPLVSLDSILGENRTYIFVLVLDEDVMRMQAVAELLNPLFEYAASHPEILILPWLRGMTLEQLQRNAFAGSSLAENLLDNVHLDQSVERLDGVTRAIKRHLESYWLKEENTYFHGWARQASVWIGYMAWGVSFGLAVMTQLIWYLAITPKSDWASFVVWPEAVSVIGVAAFSIILYELTWRGTFCVAGVFLGRTNRLWPILAQGVAAGLLWSLLGNLISASDAMKHWADLLLGCSIGMVLIALIRAGQRGKSSANFGRIPQLLAMEETVSHFYPWALKKFAFTDKRTMPIAHWNYFVSYSHSSPWCVETAQQVTKILKSLNTPVFMDRDSLHPGDAWKSRLESSLEEIDVFVVVLDSHACQKMWVASELLTAIMEKAKRRKPVFVILHPPEFNPQNAKGGQEASVISGILKEIERREMWWLKPYYFSYTADDSVQICRDIRYSLNKWWEGKVLLCGLGMVMLQLFIVIGPMLLLIVGAFQCGILPEKIIRTAVTHPLMIQTVSALAACLFGFGIPWTLFRMTRKTRMAGIVALGGYFVTLGVSLRTSDYKAYLASAICFYFGIAVSNMLVREFRNRDFEIR